jgi:hypothetical protein
MFEPYRRLLQLALALALAGGFGLGLTLMLTLLLGAPPTSWPTLAQVHGQVQTTGFLTLFIVGVGSVLFPRFLAADLDRPGWMVRGGLLVAAGLALRAGAQPVEPGPARGGALLLAALLVLTGAVSVVAALARVVRATVQPRRGWLLVAGLGFASLLLSLALGAWGAVLLASGRRVVPAPLDEAIVHLQVFGFAVSVALAVSLQVFPRFLVLQPTRAGAFPRALAGYALGLAATTASRLLEHTGGPSPASDWLWAVGAWLELASLATLLWALRLYHPPARQSNMPSVTNPTWRWFRMAYGWLLVGAALLALLATRQALGQGAVAVAELSAARHAVTQGFLLPLIVGMAGRILPVFSADMVRRPRLLEAMVDVQLVAALLRVSAELVGGYAPWSAPVVAAGGALSTAGFAGFAALLWTSLRRLPTPAPTTRRTAASPRQRAPRA